MSRNTNIRRMAEKLPVAPNLINGKPQYDSSGKFVEANHFRRLKDIQAAYSKQGYGPKSTATFKAMHAYCQMVLKYDKIVNKKSELNYRAPLIFMLVAVIAIIYKYFIN